MNKSNKTRLIGNLYFWPLSKSVFNHPDCLVNLDQIKKYLNDTQEVLK